MVPMSNKLVFSTAQTKQADRVRVWQDYMSEVFFGLEVKPDCRDYIDGVLTRRDLSMLKVSELRASAQKVVRTNELAKADRIENAVFIFPKSGSFGFRQGDLSGSAAAGQVCMLYSSEHHEVDIADNSSMVCLELPTDLLRTRIPGIDDFCHRGAFVDPLMITTLSGIANNLLRFDSTADAVRMQDVCIDLLDIAAASERGRFETWKSSRVLDDYLVAEIRRCIDTNLPNRGYALADLATACAVSKRHIQKLLGDRGTSFSQELLNARLARAAHLLKSTHSNSWSIRQIAGECGFGSQSHFSTAYRRRFDRSPRDDLRR